MANGSSSPLRIVRELRRRRVFRTAGLYVVGAWLVMQVADVLFPGWGLPDAAISVLFIAAVVGFPFALVFGWFFDITTGGIVRTPSVGEAGNEPPLPLQRRDYLILVALAAIGVAILTQTTREVVEMHRETVPSVAGPEVEAAEEKLPNSIAVLPFTNVSSDPENEFFCDGVSEEILNRLGSYSALNVIGRTSSFAFKNSGYAIPRISDLVGSRYLLQGSVRKQGERLRISAQLVNDSGTQLWSDTFDRTAGDIFSVQAEIAEVVASTVVPQIVGPIASQYQPSLEAYQHFLAGRELLRRRMSLEDAREQLNLAVELDPRFAEAYAELALTYLIGTVTEEKEAVAKRAIDTALRLEPDLPRALAIRALSLQQQREPDWAVSEIVLRRVLETEPNMVDALNWLSTALAMQGNRREAAAVLERAARLDPLHGAIALNIANAAAKRGDFETAERRMLRLLEMPQPTVLQFWELQVLYRYLGRIADMNALSKRQLLTVDEPFYVGLFDSYALLGLWEESSYWAERYKTDAPDDFWAKLASSYVPYYRGRYREAQEDWDGMLAREGRTLSEMPRMFVLLYGDQQALAGDYDGAIGTLEPMIGPPRPLNFDEFHPLETSALHSLVWSYQNSGLSEKGKPILESLERELQAEARLGRLHGSNDLYFFARNALLMGNHDLALARLEEAVAAGWREYYIHEHDGRWAPLRDNPDYQAMMADVKADVDRQRVEVERDDARRNLPALLDEVRQGREAGAGPGAV